MTAEKRRNMHRADIIAALHKKGMTLSGLGRDHNLSPYTLKNALDKPYPKGELIIASAVGLEPQIIWPERY
ncbi:helix-turn-helix transcriptional regulator [Rahnella sp. ChDrAdgB13]|uniref:helix-turn-helix domain-containing protein n=1 Tax=Rahnella sp. ChDrAdgB13 TaxID=1850581 RepID=UPI001AD896D9|nr:helix-turn-helix transcriptional regulator [Rahnella sp. ChDrAdgB13]